jgi:hypothetical protein
MAQRFTPPQKPRSDVKEIKSQLALEVLLHVYAVGGALLLFRGLLKALRVDDTLWVGAAIYGVTEIFVRPFAILPAASRALTGDLTLADATLVALVVLFPLGLLVYGHRRSQA